MLGQLATSRSRGVNYLLGVGPMASGEFCPGIYDNMAKIREWMQRNRLAVTAAKPVPAGETASVPATASGSTRYLFALPSFKAGGAYEKDLLPPADATLTLTGASQPARVVLASNGAALKHNYAGATLSIYLPANQRTSLVDVVQVELALNLPSK